MASSCPKCHRVLEQDEICCAQVRHIWRCKKCLKLTAGTAVPYGQCFICNGELEILPDRDLGDCLRFHAIQVAVQFQLSLFRFFEEARQKATTADQRLVLEHLYEAALDHLHELEEKYHARPDRQMVESGANPEAVLTGCPAECPRVKEDCGIADLYRVAIEMEHRAQEHFREMANENPAGLENELCREMAAEEDEHIMMLETELEQLR